MEHEGKNGNQEMRSLQSSDSEAQKRIRILILSLAIVSVLAIGLTIALIVVSTSLSSRSPTAASQNLEASECRSGSIIPPIVLAKPPNNGTLFFTSPAGSIVNRTDPVAYAALRAEIASQLGFSSNVAAESTWATYFYLSGTDELRAAGVNEGFRNSTFTGIMANRGGYGCARILPLLDWATIKANPKILMGYSDLTALLIAVYVKTGLITFHAPMGLSDWTLTRPNSIYAREVIRDRELVTFTNPTTQAQWLLNSTTITPGQCQGRLIGGSLTLVTSLIGSEYLPQSFKGHILFLEDNNESAYRVDRMMQTLVLSGILSEISGFVWGTCFNCPQDPRFTVEDIVAQKIAPLGIPAFSGFLFGHIGQQFTLPIGGMVRLDATQHSITMLENVLQ